MTAPLPLDGLCRELCVYLNQPRVTLEKAGACFLARQREKALKIRLTAKKSNNRLT